MEKKKRRMRNIVAAYNHYWLNTMWNGHDDDDYGVCILSMVTTEISWSKMCIIDEVERGKKTIKLCLQFQYE